VIHLAGTFPGLTWIELMYAPKTRTIEAYQQLGGILESKIWIEGEGYITAPDGPGLGVMLNEKKIDQYSV